MIRYEKWKDAKLVATELQNFPLHWFGRNEFIMCLQENGYKDITLCANYTDGLEPSSYKDTLCFSADWHEPKNFVINTFQELRIIIEI